MPRSPIKLFSPAAKPGVTMPWQLPSDLTQYVLRTFATKSPPDHVTTNDISIPLTLIDVIEIDGHQRVRGRVGAITVSYETHWKGILYSTWEHDLDLRAFRNKIIAYWASGLGQRQPSTRLDQQLRIKSAAREITHSKVEHHFSRS